MDVKDKVIEIVAQVCETTPDQISLESTIGDFPAWDSIGHLTILSTIEEQLDIQFDPEEMMDLEDVNDIIQAAAAKL